MADEREFHRGEVWWFRDAGSYEHEYGNSRPGLIVSSENGCKTSPTLQVVLTTTAPKYGVLNVPTGEYKGRKQTAMCSTIQTFSKERADSFLYTVSDKVMAEVERGLAVALGLHHSDESVGVDLEEKVEKLEAETTAQKIEIAMYQKLYEKAVDQLATMKLGFDIEKRTQKSVGASEAVAKPQQPVANEEPELVDINRCDIPELKAVGASEAVAKLIIAGRPYMKVADLMLVNGITRAWYNVVSKKVTVGDTSGFVKKKTDKLDLNECSYGELTSYGMSANLALNILNSRPFFEVEALRKVPGMREKMYEKLAQIATVGEKYKSPPPAEKVTEPKNTAVKVNINTASALEICNTTGLNMTVCYSITGCRKRNGLYKSVEDLLNIPKFTKYHLKKFGSMMEV